MKRGITTTIVGAAMIAALCSVRATAPVAAAERASWHDFNGDGFADLAIGIPGETIGGKAGAGAVEILYGSAHGLGTTGDQFINEKQALLGVGTTFGGAEAGDAFGAKLTSGDFDGDGFADLAIGVPGEDIEDSHGNVIGADRGAVVVLWGSPHGLVGPAAFRLGGTNGGRLGSALAALDFLAPGSSDPHTGDGIADLAIGSIDDTVVINAGGSRAFLVPPFTNQVVVGSVDLGFVSNAITLAAGQFDSDPVDELVVGLPNASVQTSPGTTAQNAGAIVLVDRAATTKGFTTSAFTQESFSGGGASRAGDHFGAAMVAANLVGSATGPEELVVGVPGKDITFNGASVANAGEALVVVGNIAVQLSEAPAGVPDVPEAGDAFGSSLAVGTFDAGTGLDLAVGVPGEQVGAVDGAGAVILFYDNGTQQLFDQATTGVAGTAAKNDHFGASLSAADFGLGDRTDLAVGVPADNEPNGVSDAGVVNVLYGAANGPTGSNDQLWSQASPGVQNAPNPGDRFGAGLR